MNAKIIASLAFTSMFSLSTLLSPAHAEEQEKALNFGIISTESQQNLKPQWTPFLQDMEKKLGVKVNAFFAPDYAGIIQGMRFNKVDIAWYGNLSAMEAVDRANGQVFAQTVAADGSPGYWSVLIVNKDSPINNLNDLLAKRKDLTFGNGDPNSTSGFLVPATTSSPKTISPPATSSAPSTPGMKPTRWPSPTSRWMLPPTTPKTSTS
ncbi:phosphonate ABC transporter, substrate-binding protein [Escherichia coli]|nr:phosphonate ABC transporter, substrate-binding protein [Escherichia coli]